LGKDSGFPPRIYWKRGTAVSPEAGERRPRKVVLFLKREMASEKGRAAKILGLFA